MELPSDPIILLSVVNTYLRDRFDSLENLCQSLGVDQKSLVDKLQSIGFDYMPEYNQFK